MMIEVLHPGLILILAGLILPLLPRRHQTWFGVLSPLGVCVIVFLLPETAALSLYWIEYELQLLRVDAISKPISYGLFCDNSTDFIIL